MNQTSDEDYEIQKKINQKLLHDAIQKDVATGCSGHRSATLMLKQSKIVEEQMRW